jgi:hypothetical protein
MAKLDIGRSNAAADAAADENDLEIVAFAKRLRPDKRSKCSAWAKCLEVSRATAIKPDRRLYDQCQFWSQIS